MFSHFKDIRTRNSAALVKRGAAGSAITSRVAAKGVWGAQLPALFKAQRVLLKTETGPVMLLEVFSLPALSGR